MKKNKKELPVNDRLYIRIILAVISLQFIVVASWVIIDCLNTEYIEKELIVSYGVNNNVDYKVNYKSSDFFPEGYVPKGTDYLSVLINNIDINFSYEMYTSKLINTSYTYSIESLLIKNYINGESVSELLSKSEMLVPISNQQLGKTNQIIIDENIIINYEKYNMDVLEFEDNFDIDTDSYLLLRMNIENNSNLLGLNKKIKDNRIVELKIPLGREVISISKTIDKNIQENIYEEHIINKDFNMVLFISAILMILASLPLFIISISKLLVIINVSNYVRLKRRCFRNNNDIIAEVESLPSLKNVEIIDVKTFDDLTDIEEELKHPILFNEIVKDLESWFVIMDDKFAFRYILKAKIDKNKSKSEKKK
jgi:hypothetical protein